MDEILIVDDDRDVAQTIGITLKRRDFRVQAAYSGMEALRMLKRFHPDLIILDISMPGIDGFEVCRRLRKNEETASLPIIFLTARGLDEDRIEGFRVGADDYLSKPFNPEELVLRVKAVLRRCQSVPVQDAPSTLRVGKLELDNQTFTLTTPEKDVLLTPTEFDLVYHLMAHAGEIFSSERLLREVWSFPYNTGSTDLVRAHVRNLREKIEPDPRNPVYLQTVQRHGYVIYE
jgi:DNA-binding response OmpR family regulator